MNTVLEHDIVSPGLLSPMAGFLRAPCLGFWISPISLTYSALALCMVYLRCLFLATPVPIHLVKWRFDLYRFSDPVTSVIVSWTKWRRLSTAMWCTVRTRRGSTRCGSSKTVSLQPPMTPPTRVSSIAIGIFRLSMMSDYRSWILRRRAITYWNQSNDSSVSYCHHRTHYHSSSCSVAVAVRCVIHLQIQ